MYYVRGSELNDFLRCRLRWKYAWVDSLKAKKQSDKLVFGEAFHKFLELFYGQYGMIHKNAPKDTARFMLNEKIRDELDYAEQDELLSQVADNYVRTYVEYDINNWEVIATELTFAIPLDDEIGYTGTIDLIVRDKKDGRIYFLDHKTTSSIDKYEKASDMDRQISRYWWALQQLQQGNGQVLDKGNDRWIWNGDNALDGEIGGFIYNIILKDYPVPPKVLKDGSLSKAKNQNTTYELYMKELEDRNLLVDVSDDCGTDGFGPPEEYSEILQHLKDSPKEYFRRTRVFRTQAEIDASIEELYATGHEMDLIKRHHEHHKYNPFYRNITKDCPWDCAFMEVCRAGMDGSNVSFLVDTLFTKEEK